MLNRFFAVTLSSVLLLWAGSASALPTLQLDIGGGSYDTVGESVVTTDRNFSLYALLKDGRRSSNVDDIFSISIAIEGVNAPMDLGSFTFGGVEVQVTDDMVFGVPPEELNQLADRGDLPGHDIYNHGAYFAEFQFEFDRSDKAAAYNVQDNPGGFTLGDDLFFAEFEVDLTNLALGYNLHFDLYNTEISRCNPEDIDIDMFAPFSHDAEAQSPPAQVSEPNIIALLGLGLLGMGFAARSRKGRKS